MIRRTLTGLDGKEIIELIPETEEDEEALLEMAMDGDIDGSDSFTDLVNAQGNLIPIRDGTKTPGK